MAKGITNNKESTANLGFEAKLHAIEVKHAGDDAENVFWVPADAHWCSSCRRGTCAKQPSIGKTVDDAMVALPGQLFYSTQIPVCLGFLAKDKSGKSAPARRSLGGERDRRKQTLFIDARKLGTLIDRARVYAKQGSSCCIRPKRRVDFRQGFQQHPRIPHPRHPARHAAAEAAERGVERGKGCHFSGNRVTFSPLWPAAHY